ncbi:GntR family transcriptional regulator [Cognatishimia sp. SS12]|uniref:GntR family transcriptional regulator n=1 Tax=Cognatishimia sp. SS12 TaxID=2979465 RepID=UPI00232F0F71|nr:GntR family transcriptional regulator [Cognatishimia sp. SS12]MDC0738070.1 GntR family transcriptional regulator [Cognatishimia sp. SS12]
MQPKSQTSILQKGSGLKFAYAQIKQAIIEGQIPPNTPVIEREMIERFSISRTPLREAITRLSAENLVVLRPNKSTIVADPVPSGLPAFFEAFKSISQAICYSAARAQMRRKQAHIGDHRAKIEGIENPEYADVLALLGAIGRASRNRYLALEFMRLHENSIRLSYLNDAVESYRDLIWTWGLQVSKLIEDGQDVEARTSAETMSDRAQDLLG